MVLEKKGNNPYFTLFVQPRDQHSELWHGPRTGIERAGECFGADEVHSINDLASFLAKLPSNNTIFYSEVGTDDEVDVVLQDAFKNKRLSFVDPYVDNMRVIKSSSEINIMKKSTQISCDAFIQVMKKTKQCTFESQLEAIMEYECRMAGSDRLAYPPVVSNGITNNILHYIFNDNILSDGNLILMDAGGEYSTYSSDITRTWPVNGKFTDPQAEVYSEVLNILKKCTSMARADKRMNIEILHMASMDLMCLALVKLGLVSTHSQAVQQYRRFYPHSIGHYLGMDVHDCKSVSSNMQFQPGMIVTVEPGIYIPDDPDIPKWLRGLGIRIEDDVLITEGDPLVLTSNAPKEIYDLEKTANSEI